MATGPLKHLWQCFQGFHMSPNYADAALALSFSPPLAFIGQPVSSSSSMILLRVPRSAAFCPNLSRYPRPEVTRSLHGHPGRPPGAFRTAPRVERVHAEDMATSPCAKKPVKQSSSEGRPWSAFCDTLSLRGVHAFPWRTARGRLVCSCVNEYSPWMPMPCHP
ncbi:hypothetical protein BD413DRAFT_554659 [Trametes elegans]|nr:hypothetical protein BD413DRAFT_554659 [Trametes elegans]